MLTMINGEHLHGSLYGVTFSGSLLKWQFDRMIKLFISMIISASQIIQTFFVQTIRKVQYVWGKAKCLKIQKFWFKQEEIVAKSSSKNYNSYADVHLMTEYNTPCSFMHCFQLSIKHLSSKKDTITWANPYIPTFLTEKTVA